MNSMGRITAAQIDRITQIIKNHMDVIGYITTGLSNPPSYLIKKLGLPLSITNLVTTAYQYGKLGVLQGKNLASMGITEVNRLLQDITLTKAQQHSVEQVKMKAQQAIDSLTQKIITSVTTAALNSDLKMWSVVQKVVPTALHHDTPRYQVIQQLREQSGDWKRDWHRVAQTEMWDAKLQGEAEAIVNGESPLSDDKGDTMVYKRPAPDACAKCKQLYLENDGVTPRVFKMSHLLSNGTNNGKKQSDWVPTLGVIHPNCTCSLNIMTKNTQFDKNGNLVAISQKN